jgi:hypothetical protein
MPPSGHGRFLYYLYADAVIIGQKKTADPGSADFLPYLRLDTRAAYGLSITNPASRRGIRQNPSGFALQA